MPSSSPTKEFALFDQATIPQPWHVLPRSRESLPSSTTSSILGDRRRPLVLRPIYYHNFQRERSPSFRSLLNSHSALHMVVDDNGFPRPHLCWQD